MFQLTDAWSGDARGWARVALILGTSTMTTAWLAIWVGLLGMVAHPAALAGSFQEGVVLAGAALSRWLLTGPLGERWARTIFTAAALLAPVLVVWALYYRAWLPADPRWLVHCWQALSTDDRRGSLIVTAMTVLVLWWAGGRIGAGVLDDYAVFRCFAFGLAGLFTGLLVAALAGAHGPLLQLMGAATALYFAAAFLTLPLAQISAVRERGRATGTRPPALDRRWLLPVSSATALILLLALLLSVSVSGALLGATVDALARLPDLLALVLQPLFLVAAFLMEALMGLVHWLAHLIGAGQHAAPKRLPPPPPSSRHAQPSSGHLPPLLSLVLRWGALALGALAVLTILSRTIARHGGLRQDRAYEEERDSVWSWQEARGDLRALLARLGAQMRRPARRSGAAAAGQPHTIREVYRLLLHRGALLGQPRAAPETPQEYLGRLRRLPIPDDRDASLLTSAYMGVRYGDEPEEPEDLARAARAWERLDRALNEPGS